MVVASSDLLHCYVPFYYLHILLRPNNSEHRTVMSEQNWRQDKWWSSFQVYAFFVYFWPICIFKRLPMNTTTPLRPILCLFRLPHYFHTSLNKITACTADTIVKQSEFHPQFHAFTFHSSLLFHVITPTRQQLISIICLSNVIMVTGFCRYLKFHWVTSVSVVCDTSRCMWALFLCAKPRVYPVLRNNIHIDTRASIVRLTQLILTMICQLKQLISSYHWRAQWFRTLYTA